MYLANQTTKIVSYFVMVCLIAAGLLLAGCGSHTTSVSTPGSVGAPAPVGKATLENNPPPGQPNHMTPDQQALLEHYKSMGSH